MQIFLPSVPSAPGSAIKLFFSFIFFFSFLLTDQRRVTARTSISDKDVVISLSHLIGLIRAVHRAHSYSVPHTQCCLTLLYQTYLYIYTHIIYILYIYKIQGKRDRWTEKEKGEIYYHFVSTGCIMMIKGNADPFIRLSNAPRFPRNRVSREKKYSDKPHHRGLTVPPCLLDWGAAAPSLSCCTDFVNCASFFFKKRRRKK